MPALFDPLPLPCGLTARNRVVLAPMTTRSSHPDGRVHPDELRYLERRCGGVGTAITAACYVTPAGHAWHGQWGCHDDAMLDSLHAAREVIRARGALAVLQIHHGGRLCGEDVLGYTPLAPSAVPADRPGTVPPRAMTAEEISATIGAFGAATRRAVQAGYDGVEIHGANMYLLQQFFSPHANRRDDAWGGSRERRMRFPLAVLEAVQREAARAGRPFAVGYRLSPEEVEVPGIDIEDTLVLVDALASRRPDWIHVSVRDYRKGSIRDKTDTRRPTPRIAERVAGRAPVIGVGLVHTPDEAEFVLGDGCDAVALARILLMEPEWIEKVREGRAAEIRRTMPARGGDALLTIPTPMYEHMLSVRGWLPVEE